MASPGPAASPGLGTRRTHAIFQYIVKGAIPAKAVVGAVYVAAMFVNVMDATV